MEEPTEKSKELAAADEISSREEEFDDEILRDENGEAIEESE